MALDKVRLFSRALRGDAAALRQLQGDHGYRSAKFIREEKQKELERKISREMILEDRRRRHARGIPGQYGSMGVREFSRFLRNGS
jgi:hypothetical protein